MRPTLWVIVLCLFCAACGPRYANLPPESPAKLQLAERLMRAGKHEQAAATLRTFLGQSSDHTFRARAYYDLAQAELALENPRGALDTLDQLHAEYPGETWAQVSAIRGDAHYAVGNRTEAFLAWEEAWVFSSDADRGIIQGRMAAAVPELDEPELLELSELITVPTVFAMIADRIPSELGAIASAQLAMAEQLAPPERAGAKGTGKPGPAPEEVTGLRELVPAAPAAPAWAAAKVVSLLPLTGPDKTYGARALSGLRLAFEDAPELLTVRDTGGDPVVAVKLLDELAAASSILAVIGPLRTNVAAAVAPQANSAQIPLLSLAQGEELGGSFVFPLALTRAQQLRSLLQYATTNLNARHFGILYPNEGYGQTFKQLFMETVRNRGGQVVGSLAYAPGQMDFVSEVAAVQEWSRERQLDAIFIPDAATTATSLAADIRLKLPKIILLGTESWNRPEVIAQKASWLEGALFSDAFFASSAQPSTRTFVERFQQRNGRIPTAFEAQAFDAGMLVRKALDAGAVTRAEVANQVRTAGHFEAAGRLLATRDQFQRQVFLLRVHNGTIEEVTGAAGGSELGD
jgi:branched-chain amino acid transport system substrate-binding protein